MNRVEQCGPESARVGVEPSSSDGRFVGIAAICVAALCFSLSSTVVRTAGLPGPTLAFWRMCVAAVLWWVILWITEHRTVRLDELKRSAVPGALFGLNITCFFTGVTHTTVANAEFIGSLSPLLVVPAGAIVFGERVHRRALAFGVVSLCGLALVLFSGAGSAEATWTGNLFVFAAVSLWAGYITTSRRIRGTTSVQALMAAMMTVASITLLPIVALNDDLGPVTGTGWLYVIGLAALTGTLAHGLIVFAQRAVPIGTMSLIQVAQPALAVGWAYLILDQSLRTAQVIGMAMVLAGVLAVTFVSRRGDTT